MAGRLRDGAETGKGNAEAALGAIPGIISRIGGSAADTAYRAGRQISEGFARGMEAYLGRIRQAAANMVAAAEQAVLARAMITSPSRLFADIGKFLPQGLAAGVSDPAELRRLERHSAGMVDAVASGIGSLDIGKMMNLGDLGSLRMAPASMGRQDYTLASPTGNSVVTSVHTSYGDIIINQQPGEDGEMLARRVIGILDRDYSGVNGLES